MTTPLRLTVPLLDIALPVLGLHSLEVEMPAFVQTALGKFTAVSFRLDTAAHVSEVSTDWARIRQVPITGRRVTVPVTSGAGTGLWTGWIGTIRVRVPTWGATEFQSPCFFRENRRRSCLRNSASRHPPRSDFRITGEPAARAPYGVLVVEQRTAATGGSPP
jgi:hypothetical protein